MNGIISECKKCLLCNIQNPLMDFSKRADIMVVGLSAKVKKFDNEIPLDGRTRSGKVIDVFEMISQKYDMSMYRTNIVKCAPLDSNGKLRYPTINEINLCFTNLIKEIKEVSPKVIILLGDIVRKAVAQNLDIKIEKPNQNYLPIIQYEGMYIITMYHPSYLLRSKKRVEQNYRSFEEIVLKIKEKMI